MLLSLHQKRGQNHEIKVANRLFENVSQFKYLGWQEGKRPPGRSRHRWVGKI
jgi:hypothetical protein